METDRNVSDGSYLRETRMNVQKSQSEAESSFAVALGVLHRQVEKQPTSAVLTFLSTLI
jgi:hypothetical protein